MKIVDLTNYQFPSSRALFRERLISIFLNEDPGTGNGMNASRYQYVVKKIDGHDIYLSRPAQFNNGFDFTLNVSNINFNAGMGRSTNRPTHQNILNDLLLKKNENLPHYINLIAEITNVYNCQPISNRNFGFQNGHSLEIILECVKWLFAEQDVTYWNYSGRTMFYNAILAV